MHLVSEDDLTTLVAGIFQSRGVPEEDSQIAAECLVHADLCGTVSHGVIRVAYYVDCLESRGINPAAQVTLERTGAATATLDGDDGLGHVAAYHAMKAAIEIARESGVGFVTVNHSSHCGALSFYGKQAIDAGLVGLAFTQTDAIIVPIGGRKPFCGTNPLCVAVPAERGSPILLDMATSTVAGGYIYKARAENRAIPDTWAVDKDGQPTTDPHAAAYWTPMGGAKGYALGVVIDVLTGLLAGGTTGPHIPAYEDHSQIRGICHLVAAIDPARFPGGASFPGQVSQMVDELHDVPPAEGVERVRAPGEGKYNAERRHRAEGIPLEDYLWAELNTLAIKAMP